LKIKGGVMKNHDTSILIVEDDPEVLSTLKSIFSKYFNTVYTALNGNLAQIVLKENIPDILLTDIQMPEVDGIELVIKMRSQGNNIPVVMLSSCKDRELLIKAIRLGVQDFIEKPFKKSDLEMAVHRSLEVAVRNNSLSDLSIKYGSESFEVKKQQKLIGLLKAISAKA
jgi:YesN/AraC family two-component response regulator